MQVAADSALSARGVTLELGGQLILREVDLEVAAGEVVALTGPSGSGKTSLLHCLSGLVRPTSGEVVVHGRSLSALGREELAEVRRTSMGFVFQDSGLVAELSLLDNAQLPLDLLGVPRAEGRRVASGLLERLGLSGRAHAGPDQVSGGEAQRTAVARAIAHRPGVVFADEPTGALDSHHGATVLEALLGLAKDAAAAVLLVTHDSAVAARADRIVQLRDGALLA